jgi:hypothetical protein
MAEREDREEQREEPEVVVVIDLARGEDPDEDLAATRGTTNRVKSPTVMSSARKSSNSSRRL